MTTAAAGTRPPEMLYEVDSCPLCGSTAREYHSTSRPNLYSEKLALIAGLEELAMIEAMPNMTCRSCGLIYKRRWLPQKMLETLFRDAVPWHPKGWDAVSGRFTPENFFAELDLYEAAIRDQDAAQAARWRRALLSIIDSVSELDAHPEKRVIESAIEQGDCEAIRNRQRLIQEKIAAPASFKRFSGFRSREMWDWCVERVGSLQSYAEVGCPLWGMLPIARDEVKNAVFLSRPEPNYWNSACRMNGRSCTAAMKGELGIGQDSWEAVEPGAIDLLGLFQYLDHLEKPLDFMHQLFARARSCALILDHFSQPTAIQHFTGWTRESIHWLAEHFGKHVDDSFEPIRDSGNRLYLLV